MRIALRAWIGGHLRRRGLLRRTRGLPADQREPFIRRHVPGKSFADIGGLYGIHGDMAFLAEEAGAERVTLFDAGDPDFSLFAARRNERGSSIRYVQGDLEDPHSVEEIGKHDIVYCVGVIYHTPNPLLQLMHLRRITGELLFLGTHTIPEVPGVENACVFYPHLPDSARAEYARAHPGGGNMLGVVLPFDDRPMHGHGNFWWGITPSALRAMMLTARFEIVEELPVPRSPFFMEVIAKPIDEHPVMPPVDYYRIRGKRREQGERMPFDEYYDSVASLEHDAAPDPAARPG